MYHDIRICGLSEDNLNDIADIHMNAFPMSAVTSLGLEAIRRYYHWQMFGPHDIVALGAFQNKALIGFCFGGVFRGSLTGFVRKNFLFLLWRVMSHPWLLREPMFRTRMRTGIHLLRPYLTPSLIWQRERSIRQYSAKTFELTQSFGILSIATHPLYQFKGVGKQLMKKIEDNARELGFHEMHLTVDNRNIQALNFYHNLSWIKVTQNGVWKGQLTKSL